MPRIGGDKRKVVLDCRRRDEGISRADVYLQPIFFHVDSRAMTDVRAERKNVKPVVAKKALDVSHFLSILGSLKKLHV